MDFSEYAAIPAQVLAVYLAIGVVALACLIARAGDDAVAGWLTATLVLVCLLLLVLGLDSR